MPRGANKRHRRDAAKEWQRGREMRQPLVFSRITKARDGIQPPPEKRRIPSLERFVERRTCFELASTLPRTPSQRQPTYGRNPSKVAVSTAYVHRSEPGLQQ